MWDEIKETPPLTLAASTVASLTTLGNVTNALGLPPFWSDAVSTTLLLFASFSWFVEARNAAQAKKRQAGFTVGPAGRRIALMPLVVIATFVGLAGWIGSRPLLLVRDRNWTVCATFLTPCAARLCLAFSDSQGRPTTKDCLDVDDDAGFKKFSQPTWWTYRPASVTMTCKGALVKAAPIGDDVYSARCPAVVK